MVSDLWMALKFANIILRNRWTITSNVTQIRGHVMREIYNVVAVDLMRFKYQQIIVPRNYRWSHLKCGRVIGSIVSSAEAAGCHPG